MQGHELLQTIARVNRLFEGKDFGYIIDYCGVLKRLDEALDLYSSLEEFNEADVDGVVTDASDEVRRLPQRHSDLWEVFKTVANKRDEEAYERYLADEAERVRFYERLRDFGRSLAVALSTVQFITDTPEAKIAKYKSDLKFFMTLRAAVRRRYAEVVDFKEYEGKIQKLLDAHVGAVDAEVLTPLVNIFDVDAFAKEVEKLETPSSKADTIAYRTKATITARMDEDPAFYKKFSTMLEDAIAEYKAERISDLEYLRRVQQIQGHVVGHTGDDTPDAVRHNELQRSYFGILREGLVKHGMPAASARELAADAAQLADEIIHRLRIVNWKKNDDVKKPPISPRCRARCPQCQARSAAGRRLDAGARRRSVCRTRTGAAQSVPLAWPPSRSAAAQDDVPAMGELFRIRYHYAQPIPRCCASILHRVRRRARALPPKGHEAQSTVLPPA